MECIVAKVNLTDCILVDDKLYRNLKKKIDLFIQVLLIIQNGNDMDFFLKEQKKLSLFMWVENLGCGIIHIMKINSFFSYLIFV